VEEMNQAPAVLDATNSIIVYGHIAFSDGSEPAFVQEFEFRGTRVGIFEQKGLTLELTFGGVVTKVRLPLAERNVFGVRLPVQGPPESYEIMDRLVFRLEGCRDVVMESVALLGGYVNIGTVMMERI
jgi:hypothetical protein